MDRDGFVFYRSFMAGVETLSSPEEKLKAYQYILTYGLYGDEPEEKSGPAYGMFIMAKPQIDANNKKYVNGCKGGQYGAMGGRPPKDWDNSQKPLRGNKDNPIGVEKITPKDKEKDKEKEKEKEKGYGGKQATLDASASRGIVEKKSVVGNDEDKYEANGMKLSDKLSELGLEDEIIGLAITYNSCKKGKKLDKFKDAQLKIRVDKLRRCGFNTIEGMKQVLENSIAGGYEGIFELKQKPNIKPKSIEEGKVVNVNGANIFF